MIRSTDAGATWTRQQLPAGTGDLADISCTDASDCLAVGTEAGSDIGAIVTTTDAGKKWTAETVPKKIGDLGHISCAGPTACWVTGAVVTAVTGHSPDGAALSTASGVVSYAGGPPVVLATADGGERWKSEVLPATTTGLSGISCPTTSACWSTGTTSTNVVILALGTTPPVITGDVGHHARGRRRG